MAAIKIAYIGGGSTRAPAVTRGIIERAEAFAGSEVVLIDLDEDHLDVILRLSRRMAESAGADITFSATTDRRAGLRDADIVLTSFRPGGFEARRQDELIPLRHGVIGQETQGPGGFFMALRAIEALKPMLDDMNAVCPNAILLNYTNPVNIVAQAVASYAQRQVISLCEGPIIFPREVAEAAQLDPEQLDVTMIGLNHGSWSIHHEHAGDDLIEKVRAAFQERAQDPGMTAQERRLLHMTATFGSVPAQYFKYYYFRDEILAELQSSPTSRAEDITADVPDQWAHYAEQADASNPALDPARCRGGMDLLEIAVDVMDAIANDKAEVWPVNVPNCGAIQGLADDLVVEVPGLVGRRGARPIASGPVPANVQGLVAALASYQLLTAEAAWHGSREMAVQALAANPLVPSLPVAEALYAEMAQAQSAHLPARLVDGGGG
ncbi:glycoside hydrolase [Thalassorhabdomicrobium marinisediminis]|uniref:Glycoside hydrolase n=1 Tax=Thalassorhabdomicrobium marinisediminis TaxID=2170577 RepID=A0A2T7FT60_9RHOB|nr:glycoside hydrolase [Thalassorhabdomicrobium marinisediminis]PVA05359.1 glycoside hydrolase [Thalassorhabdomicrobium marinisediminis]